MYTDEYNKALERVKTGLDLAKDYANMQRCSRNLQQYNRLQAWNCLQDVIREYHDQIAIIGGFEGIRLYRNVPLASVSDEELRSQLQYFGQRIPAYVLVREGQKELGKRIHEWLTNEAMSSTEEKYD